MNVIGKDGVNYGHPGVIYNAIDENNFDYMLLRFVSWESLENLMFYEGERGSGGGGGWGLLTLSAIK